ncbi:GAF domain-containing protein [Bacillus sp. PS06]|uniref:GAF domain-containing protein n=1 Tax=Bacillus sp. PS06 TaxID=2764176 RepID=UPI001780BA49|nr:GAF domain-containing protein [Bacillus sp. PS06]MBD8070575.1 GAF domain-containing protein [Bacillus sp. PS06]
MEKLNVDILEQLNEIRLKTSSDFSAVAYLYKESLMIHWAFASGNLNERYKSMQSRPGKGVAGLVIRADRAMILDDSVPNLHVKRLEDPMMCAENLLAAVGVPVKTLGRTNGVLFVGSREQKTYTEQDIEMMNELAKNMGGSAEQLKVN